MRVLRRRGILVGLAALATGGAAALLVREQAAPASDGVPGMLWPGPPELDAFALEDQDGAAFDLDSLRGRWSLMFFGYVHCPDVCPATLALMAEVHRRRGAGDDLHYVFVTIDPQRDDRATLAEYVRYFSPDFVAVRGPRDALTPLTSRFGVIALRAPGSGDDYLIDHTASLFVVDPQARLVAVVQPPHRAAEVSERIDAVRQVVAAAG